MKFKVKHLLIPLIILIFSFGKLFSQAEGNNWYFGFNSGLNFSGDFPVLLHDGALNTLEGCSSISKKNGELLFYTDGVDVYTKDHNIMENGSSLNGHESSTNSALILKKPGSEDKYYIFTTDYQIQGKGLCYSVVNMKANSGKGKLQKKNTKLFSDAAEKIVAIRHENQEDFWIVGKQLGGDSFHSFLVDKYGVHKNSIISNTGSALSVNIDNAVGSIAANIQGTIIAVANSISYKVSLIRFNKKTGKLSDSIILDFPYIEDLYPYGLEFSPNGKYLYVSLIQGIIQFNIESFDKDEILNSAKLISDKGPNGEMQLGPDERIYVAHPNRDYLGVINKPNNQGDYCYYFHGGLNLGNMQSGYGLPRYENTMFFIDRSDIKMPNVFTPNNDGFNDSFTYIEKKDVLQMHVFIYNRWGNLVYEFKGEKFLWDGTFNGEKLSDGVYFWRIQYLNIGNMWKETHGSVTIIH